MLRARISRQTSNPSRGAGQADVEDDDPGVLLLEDLEALFAVAGQQHAEALAPQVEVHQIGDVRVVLDDDHRPVLRAHVPSLASPAPRIAGMAASLTEPSRLAEHAVHGRASCMRSGGRHGGPVREEHHMATRARTHLIRLGAAGLRRRPRRLGTAAGVAGGCDRRRRGAPGTSGQRDRGAGDPGRSSRPRRPHDVTDGSTTLNGGHRQGQRAPRAWAAGQATLVAYLRHRHRARCSS